MYKKTITVQKYLLIIIISVKRIYRSITVQIKQDTKLKDKIYSSFLKSFLVCLISSSFDCLLPRFKGSHRELSKYIKSFQRTFDKEKFQFLYLISYQQFNVIHLIYVVKCFPSNVIIFIAAKNYMNFIFYFFFWQILQVFISPRRLCHLLVFIAKL